MATKLRLSTQPTRDFASDVLDALAQVKAAPGRRVPWLMIWRMYLRRHGFTEAPYDHAVSDLVGKRLVKRELGGALELTSAGAKALTKRATAFRALTPATAFPARKPKRPAR